MAVERRPAAGVRPRPDRAERRAPAVLIQVCHTVICQAAEGGDRRGSGVSEHGR
jgi:hypothetical protein